MGICCVKDDLSKDSNFNLSKINTEIIFKKKENKSFSQQTNYCNGNQKNISKDKINFFFSESVRVKNSNFFNKVNFKNKFLFQENQENRNIEIIESCECEYEYEYQDHIDMKVFNTLTEETLEDTYKTNSSSRNITDYKDYNFTKGKPFLKTNNLSNHGSVIKEVYISDTDSLIDEKIDLFSNELQNNLENIKNFKFDEFSLQDKSLKKLMKSQSLDFNSSNVSKNNLHKSKNTVVLKNYAKSSKNLPSPSNRNSLKIKSRKINNNVLLENSPSQEKKLNLNNSFRRRERHDSFRNTKKFTKDVVSYRKESLTEDSNNEKKLNLVKYKFLFSDVESHNSPRRICNSSKNVISYKN